MRVRFAPSPTGALHIGGVRTALYNYLLARQQGGTVVLRIEDTDQTRYVPGAEAYILEALEWLGMEFDESPKKGGPYGPYRQSERKAQGLYQEFAELLVKNGHGYYAYDTEEELTALRAAAEAAGNTFKYDATTRMNLKNSLALTPAQCEQLEAKGAPKVVRVMIPAQGNVTFKDEVRGVVRFDCSDLDDKVMLKNDGMPTYHLANIVDDYHMKITHVIRGEEWLPSTPLHVLLYEFLGWKNAMPTFAHLPLLLKPEPAAYLTKKTVPVFAERLAGDFVNKQPDFAEQQPKVQQTMQTLLQEYKNLSERLRVNEKKDSKLQREVKEFLRSTLYGKLSKRDGDRLGMPVFPLDWQGATPEEHFNGFREWGFLPEAVLNLLLLLGWNEGTDRELYDKQSMIEAFSLERVSPSGARFNFAKAKWFNKQYLAQIQAADLLALVEPQLKEKGVDTSHRDQLLAIAELLKVRLDFVGDFYEQSSYFYEALDYELVFEQHQKNFQKKVLDKWNADQKAFLEQLIAQIQQTTPYTTAALEASLAPLIGDRQGEVLPIFRLGLSGNMGGPSIYDIMAILGSATVTERLQQFMAFCEAHQAAH